MLQAGQLQEAALKSGQQKWLKTDARQPHRGFRCMAEAWDPAVGQKNTNGDGSSDGSQQGSQVAKEDGKDGHGGA